jgi:Amidohydrolase family
VTGEAFYVPVTGPPEMLGVLARALLKAPEHRLALLPTGEATIEAVGPLPQDAAAAASPAIIQYRISGLDFSPTRIWLDRDGETVAIVSNWLSVLSPAAHSLLTPLLAAQEQSSAVWSARLAREQTAVPEGDVVIRNARQIAPRIPAQVRRSMLSGALAIPPGQEAAYREALPAMLKLLKALYDAGVIIIPGTDSFFAGYALHHELELYARAGIAPLEVLRLATLTSAQVIGVDRERGVIAAGKLADLILVDGDPSVHIRDLDRVALVMKGGRIYEPARIERALGIAPRDPGVH